MTYFPKTHQIAPSDITCAGSCSTPHRFDFIKSRIKDALHYLDAPRVFVAHKTGNLIVKNLLALLNGINDSELSYYCEKEIWQGSSEKNLLHHLCLMTPPTSFDGICKIISLCPELLFQADPHGNLPLDYLSEDYVDPLIALLTKIPHPESDKTMTTGESYRWLSHLCRLKNPAFALAYADKNPHALLPIEFTDLSTVKEEGRFLPHEPEELPIYILSHTGSPDSTIDRFLKIWHEKMEDQTGILSLFLLLYTTCRTVDRLEYKPESNFSFLDKKSELTHSIHFDLTKMFIILKSHNNSNILWKKWMLLANYFHDKESERPEFISQSVELIKKNNIDISMIHTIYSTCLQIVMKGGCVLIQELSKKYPIQLLPYQLHTVHLFNSEILKIIYKGLLKTTPNELLEVDISYRPNNLVAAIHKFKKSKQFLDLFKKYAKYNPHRLNVDCGIHRYVLGKLADIPIVNPREQYYTSVNVSDQFKVLKYFVWDDNERSPEFIPRVGSATKKFLKVNFGDRALTNSTMVTPTTAGYEFLPASTTVEINFNSSYKCLTLLISHQDAVYTVHGFFRKNGFADFLKKFIASVEENKLFAGKTNKLPAHRADSIDSFTINEECHNHKLPLAFSVNLSRRCLYMSMIHPESFIKMVPYKIDVNIYGGVIFELNKHITQAVNRYKFSFAKQLNKRKIAKRDLSTFSDGIRYRFQRYPGVIANALLENLEKRTKKYPEKVIIIGDPYTDRYVAGWNNPSKQIMILSKEREERLKEIAILSELRPLSKHSALSPDRFNKYVIEDNARLIHDEPFPLTLEECMASFEELGRSTEFIERTREGFQFVTANILDETGFVTTPDVLKSLKILFTHSFQAYKLKGPEPFSGFIEDIEKHNGFCIIGLKKELWQHYYTNFPEALEKKKRTFFERAITLGTHDLVDRLRSCATDKRATVQSVHYINFLRNHISQKIKIPHDPNTIEFSDLSIDPNAITDEIGDDYDPLTLPSISEAMLLPTMVTQLIKQWDYFTGTKKCDKYKDLYKEFIALERTPPLVSDISETAKREIFLLTPQLREKYNKLKELQNSREWKIYSTTLAALSRSVPNASGKRERSSETVRLPKRQCTPASTATIPVPPSSSTSTSFIERTITAMKENALIQEILALQVEINKLAFNLSNQHKILQKINENYADALYERKELTQFDDFLCTQQLTVQGALTWLKLKGV